MLGARGQPGRAECALCVRSSRAKSLGRQPARRYEKGETIAYYDGKDVTDAAPKKTDYVLEIEHRRVDGFGAFHGLQYINDARGSEFRNNIRINKNPPHHKNLRRLTHLVLSRHQHPRILYVSQEQQIDQLF